MSIDTGEVDRHPDTAPRLCDGPRTGCLRGHTRRTQGKPWGAPRMARSLTACADPGLSLKGLQLLHP
jgi:hypothetical protein